MVYDGGGHDDDDDHGHGHDCHHVPHVHDLQILTLASPAREAWYRILLINNSSWFFLWTRLLYIPVCPSLHRVYHIKGVTVFLFLLNLNNTALDKNIKKYVTSFLANFIIVISFVFFLYNKILFFCLSILIPVGWLSIYLFD